MVTLDSRPFQNGDMLFRNSTDGECYAGEPTTLASDLHRLGLGKIATVPAVNVAYKRPRRLNNKAQERICSRSRQCLAAFRIRQWGTANEPNRVAATSWPDQMHASLRFANVDQTILGETNSLQTELTALFLTT